MVGKAILAALTACGCVCAASADETGKDLDLGLLHWIRDTVCTPGEAVLFIPVSNDVPTLDRTYAVVPKDDLNTITAHIVTPEQRAWLTSHGCSAQAPQPQYVAELTSGEPESGRLDF